VNTTATSEQANGNAAVAEAQPMREDARRERGEGRRERGEGRRERTPRGERPARDPAPLDAVNTGLSETAPPTPEALDSAAGEERRERRTRDRYGRDRRGDRPGRESGVAMAPEGDIVIAQAATTPASTPAERVAMPSIQSYTLPVDSLVAVAQAAQLEWVQSDSARVAQIQAAIAAEPKPIHVPRERPPLVVLDEGPLILVETKKDLGQVKMPFDA
jgi:ribonuclease E